MQDKNSSLRGFTQEDFYPVAREDGTGWITSKDILLKICHDQPDFESAYKVAQDWDETNEPPWGDKLRNRLTGLWNWVHTGESQSFNNLPTRRLERPPVPNYAIAEAIVAKYGQRAAERITSASHGHPHAAQVLDFLFPNNPWIAVSWYDPADQFTTQRETIRGHEVRFAWLTPNPFKGKQVLNHGKWSMKCDANILVRNHLVIEFDLKRRYGWGPSIEKWSQAGFSALDVHGAFFLWITARTGFKPFMIAFSGSVSYHAWYDVRGIPEDQIARLVSLTLPFSGDPRSLVPSQLFRMPGGTRLRRINNKITRVPQRVVYWNPY